MPRGPVGGATMTVTYISPIAETLSNLTSQCQLGHLRGLITIAWTDDGMMTETDGVIDYTEAIATLERLKVRLICGMEVGGG